MKKRIFATEASWIPFILRTLLGFVVFPHGAQKLFGLFGGFGFSGTMDYFTNSMGIPWIVSFLVILLESVGSVALVAGFATRILAFAAVGIVFTAHVQLRSSVSRCLL